MANGDYYGQDYYRPRRNRRNINQGSTQQVGAGSYENPAGVIDNRYQNVASVIAGLSDITDAVLFAENQKEKSAKALEDQYNKWESNLTQEYLKTTSKLREFEGGLQEADKNVLDREVKTALQDIGDGFSKWLRDNPDATQRERTLKLDEAIGSMQLLREDLAGLIAAEQQWSKFSQLEQGEVDSIMPGFNDDLISAMRAIDSEDSDMHITRDPNGDWRFTVAKFDEKGNVLVDESATINTTNLRQQALQGGGFFKQVQEFDTKPGVEFINKLVTRADGTLVDSDLIVTNADGSKTLDVEALKANPAFTEYIKSTYIQDPMAKRNRDGYKVRLGVEDDAKYENAIVDRIIEDLNPELLGPAKPDYKSALDKEKLLTERSKQRANLALAQQRLQQAQKEKQEANFELLEKLGEGEKEQREANNKYSKYEKDRKRAEEAFDKGNKEIVSLLKELNPIAKWDIGENGEILKGNDKNEFIAISFDNADQLIEEIVRSSDNYTDYTAREKETFRTIYDQGGLQVEVEEEEVVQPDSDTKLPVNSRIYKSAVSIGKKSGINFTSLPESIQSMIIKTAKDFRANNPTYGYEKIYKDLLTDKEVINSLSTEEWNQIWKSLKPGKSMLGPDGKKHTKQ